MAAGCSRRRHDNPDHARKIAENTPTEEWEQAISDLEVEDEDGNPVEEA